MQCLLKQNECLTIGSIQINVLEVGRDSVKLGIDDPSASPRYRVEVLYLPSDDDEDSGDQNDFLSTIEHDQFEQVNPFAVPIL